MWAQLLLRCRDNLAYTVILFTMFFSAQHSSEVCIGSIRDMREGEGEVEGGGEGAGEGELTRTHTHSI